MQRDKLDKSKALILMLMLVVLQVLLSCSGNRSVDQHLNGELSPWIDSVLAYISSTSIIDDSQSMIYWQDKEYVHSWRRSLSVRGSDAWQIDNREGFLPKFLLEEIMIQVDSVSSESVRIDYTYSMRCSYRTSDYVDMEGQFSDIDVFDTRDSLIVSFYEFDGFLQGKTEHRYAGDTIVSTIFDLDGVPGNTSKVTLYSSRPLRKTIKIDNKSEGYWEERTYLVRPNNPDKLLKTSITYY